jgi:hypothetical protein
VLQACTFKPEQLSAHKAMHGRALLMSGVGGWESPARSSRFSAVAAMDDLDKYEVGHHKDFKHRVLQGDLVRYGVIVYSRCC